MLARLETMAVMGGELPLSAIREQIGSAIDLLVHLARARDGSRSVQTVLEVEGYDRNTGTYKLRTLYENQELYR